MAGAGYTRWTADEYIRVAVNALAAIDAGKPKLEILKAGMRAALPRSRWRGADELKHLTYPSMYKTFEKYVAKARTLDTEARAALTAAAPPPPPTPGDDAPQPHTARKRPSPVDESGRSPIDGLIHHNHRNSDVGRNYKNGIIKWTDHEKARLARMVRYWIDNDIDKRNMGRLFAEAQELVIAPERRRTIGALQQANMGGSTSANAKAYADGLNSLYLIAGEKFHPEGEYGPKADERRAREAREAQEQRERTQAGFVPPTTIAEVRQVLGRPDTGFDDEPAPDDSHTITNDGMRYEVPRRAVQPDLPFPHSTGSLDHASRVFGETMMAALEKLLAVHTNVLMSEFNARIVNTAASTGAAIAMQIEQTLRGTVQGIINEELGNPPEPPPEEKRRLKVDVVGFEMGAHQQAVAQVCNGVVDVRFVHPDKASTYAPIRERHVILLTGRVPHKLGDKIKAAGVEPIYVNRTTGHVIHAIEELMRAEGIEPAHA